MFCITLNPNYYFYEELFIKIYHIYQLDLGIKNFPMIVFSDKAGENISNKNTYYGEYTFHYWLWKNYLNKIKTDWVGFCQYRKFFIKDDMKEMNLNFDIFKRILIKNIDILDEKFDCLLGNKFSVQNYKFSKIVKNHLKEFLKNPSLIFNKEKFKISF